MVTFHILKLIVMIASLALEYVQVLHYVQLQANTITIRVGSTCLTQVESTIYIVHVYSSELQLKGNCIL